MMKVFFLLRLSIFFIFFSSNAAECTYPPYKSDNGPKEEQCLSAMSKNLKRYIEWDLTDRKNFGQTGGLPTHDDIKKRALIYIRDSHAFILNSHVSIEDLEEKIFRTILNQNDSLLKIWSFIGALYIERGHKLEKLLALLESRVDMTVPIKSKILSKLIQLSRRNKLLIPYIMGLLAKGEFQFVEFSKIMSHLKQEFLEPRDWLVLIDYIFSKPAKGKTLKKTDKSEGAVDLRLLKMEFIVNYYRDQVSKNNKFKPSCQTLQNFCDYQSFKSVMTYPKAYQNMLQIIYKTNRSFDIDIAIIEHLFQRYSQETDIRFHLMNHWLSYIYHPETKLSMTQIGTLMQKTHDMENKHLATNLYTRMNQLLKSPTRRMPTISFVASQENTDTLDYFRGNLYPSLSLVIPELQSRGFFVEVLSWEDASIDWSARKCLFIPHVWGYTKKAVAFYEWLEKIKFLKIPLINSIEFVEWDINKNYLDDLQKEGIPVIPTMIIQKESTISFDEILRRAYNLWNTNNIIAKGLCDAGGNGYKRYVSDQEEDMKKHIEILKNEYNGAVVQPFWPEITEKGELSFVFIGNALSHVYLKVCAPDSELVQVLHKGRSFHINQYDLSCKKSEFFKKLKEFRPDLKITLEELVLAHGKIYKLFYDLNKFFSNNNIPMPPIFRLDCVIRNNQLYIMEIEGIPYLEMKEAISHDENKRVVEWYADEVLRQLSLRRKGAKRQLA